MKPEVVIVGRFWVNPLTIKVIENTSSETKPPIIAVGIKKNNRIRMKDMPNAKWPANTRDNTTAIAISIQPDLTKPILLRLLPILIKTIPPATRRANNTMNVINSSELID